MLNGAVEIIAGAPARHLHPVHLARSQAADACGYVLIAYAEDLPGNRGHSGRTFHDLYLFRGPVILETVRFTRHLRFAIRRDAAHRAFESLRHHPSTRVSCFQADAEVLELLRATCRLLPSVKTPVGAVDPEAWRAAFLATAEVHGILEWCDFDRKHPLMHLQEVRTEGELARFSPPGGGGTLLYYDLRENREYLLQAPQREVAGTPSASPSVPAAGPAPKSAEPSELVRAADRLCRAFRQRAADVVGAKCSAAFARAERELRFLSPGFDPAALADDTAVLVLDLIERVVAAAPFWRRPALRAAAESLLSEFYGKHYDLLERRNVLDAVEQAYYRLKR
jgi:hypothetical protein